MSSWLQLADLVARPIGLNTFKPLQENQAFEVIKRKFYCSGGRSQAGVGYKNIGMKIYPHGNDNFGYFKVKGKVVTSSPLSNKKARAFKHRA